jgi:hypothetical protein
MTGISLSGSKEYFTGEYAPPDTCTYYAYRCTYCEQFFYLVDPKTFQAGGAKRTVQYRNKETGEIDARENRSEGVCLDCAKEIMRRQQR